MAVTIQHTLIIPGFCPTTTNRLLYSVASRIRLKKGDRELVVYYAREQQIPPATGKRRVSLIVTGWASGGRLPDVDSFWKSLLDALVHAGALVDDSQKWCECGSVEVRRGPRETVVTLEEVG